MSAAVDWPAFARRVWSAESAGGRLMRAALLVPAAAYRAGVAARNGAYDVGLLHSRPLPLPSLGVGNLAVGGTGKTPLASYLARELVRRGARPGILLRGYAGSDETEEHRARVGEAVVVADADRRRGAERAAAAGADVLVLDDCLQRRDVRTDVLLAVVAAETSGARMWRLPAGPWREGLEALRRCDGVVVTHKTAGSEAAEAVARDLAPRTRLALGIAAGLEVARFVPVSGGAPLPPGWLAGRDVVALCGIGAPELFRAQLERLGARVRLLAFGDHHAYSGADVTAAMARAGPDGAIVTTAKDAAKLRNVWRAAAPACMVAELEVRVSYGQDDLGRLLDGAARQRHELVAAEARPTPRQTPL